MSFTVPSTKLFSANLAFLCSRSCSNLTKSSLRWALLFAYKIYKWRIIELKKRKKYSCRYYKNIIYIFFPCTSPSNSQQSNYFVKPKSKLKTLTNLFWIILISSANCLHWRSNVFLEGLHIFPSVVEVLGYITFGTWTRSTDMVAVRSTCLKVTNAMETLVV